MPITIYQNDHLDETKLLTPPKFFFDIRFSTLELVEIDPNAAADPTQARSRALVFIYSAISLDCTRKNADRLSKSTTPNVSF